MEKLETLFFCSLAIMGKAPTWGWHNNLNFKADAILYFHSETLVCPTVGSETSSREGEEHWQQHPQLPPLVELAPDVINLLHQWKLNLKYIDGVGIPKTHYPQT